MPHASFQVASKSGLMHFPYEFWHKYSQRFPNQLGRIITKDSRSSGIGEEDATGFVCAEYSVVCRLNQDAIPLFTEPACGFFVLAFGDIGNNAADGVNLSLRAEQRELVDDARMLSVFLESRLLKLHRNACLEHLPV